jgi:coenzyme F420-0:L-glutamate ligase/coenzyme F420-1:gamma-L-glutamate ligase
VSRLEIRPVTGLPEVEPGAALGAMVAAAGDPRDGEIVVVSQKVVSKAEGRTRRLAEVEPSDRALDLAEQVDKDPRLVELILAETAAIIRAGAGLLIVETRSGLVCANAGIDASNALADDTVVLLPEDPDASARRLRAEIADASGARPAVLIADSFGRPWRLGQTDVAIGCAGLRPLDDWRGRSDRAGRELAATEIAIADEVAAAAGLAHDKASGEPAAVVSGLARHVCAEDGPGAAALRRDPAHDRFR